MDGRSFMAVNLVHAGSSFAWLGFRRFLDESFFDRDVGLAGQAYVLGTLHFAGYPSTRDATRSESVWRSRLPAALAMSGA